MDLRSLKVLLALVHFLLRVKRRSLHFHKPKHLQPIHKEAIPLPMAIRKVTVSLSLKQQVIRNRHTPRYKLIINGLNQLIRLIQATRKLRTILPHNLMHRPNPATKAINPSLLLLTLINRLMASMGRGHNQTPSMDCH